MSTEDLQSPSLPETGSTDGVNLRGGVHADAEGRAAPPAITGGALYCIYPRAFSPEGTLAAVERELDRVVALGASAIWLLPVHPVGLVDRKGSAGSPYSIRDYRAVDPALGTEDSLRSLVEAAHVRSLRVLIDYVANHAARDHVERGRHPDWFARNGSGAPVCRVSDWSDVVDWRFESEGVGDYLVESALHWVRDVGVDGFRCDVAGMVPAEFWSRLIRVLETVHPDPFLLAEWQDAYLHTVAFHASYDWQFYRALRDTAQGRVGARAVTAALESWAANFPSAAIPLRFVENHDEPRAMSIFGRDRVMAYTAVAYLSGGWPLVYAGQEAGASHRPSLFEREVIDFSGLAAAGEGGIADLLRVRRESPWRSGATAVLVTDRPETVVALRRTDGESSGVLIANLGRDEEVLRVSGADGEFHRILGRGPSTWSGESPLTLAAGEVWIGGGTR